MSDVSQSEKKIWLCENKILNANRNRHNYYNYTYITANDKERRKLRKGHSK